MTEPRPYRGLHNGGLKYGYHSYDFIHSEDVIVNSEGSWPVPSETVGQFTGLKDKKRKHDVYKDDIVLCFSKEDPSLRFKGVIKYCAPEFYLACFWQDMDGEEDSYPVGENNRSLIRGAWIIEEILGNIHQNPDLLKGAE